MNTAGTNRLARRTSIADRLLRGGLARPHPLQAGTQSMTSMPIGDTRSPQSPCASMHTFADGRWQAAPDAGNPLRLTCYRVSDDEVCRLDRDRAFELWLHTCLQACGKAVTWAERTDGQASLWYAHPELLGSGLPDAAFTPAKDTRLALPEQGSHFPHAALITGTPRESPWNLLLAPGAVAGDFRVQLRAFVLPPTWLAARLDELARWEARATAAGGTRSLGTTSTRMEDPTAYALRAGIRSERERLLASGEHVTFCMVIEARDPRGLETACAIATGCMTQADNGAPVPPPRRFALSDARTTIPAVVPLTAAARAMQPPTVSVPGISVANANVTERSPRAFASNGWEAHDGIVLGETEHGERCVIPLERLAQHAVVVGQPGMGKSRLTASLAQQLTAQRVNVIVLEPAKAEYAPALAHARCSLAVFGDRRAHPSAMDGAAEAAAIRDLRENMFAVDRGVLPGLWIQDLSNCLVSALGMQEDPLPLHLEGLLVHLYRTAGISLRQPATERAAWPWAYTLSNELEPYIAQSVAYSDRITSNVRGALRARIDGICRQPALCTPTGLMANDLLEGPGATVLQLCDLGDIHGSLTGMILLARLMRTARLMGTRRLHTVVIIEEAHALLNDRTTGEPTRFARMLESAIAELRASGIGFLTVDQRPSQLPSGVLANSATRVCFNLGAAQDFEAAGRSMGLNEYQQRRLSRLDPGYAVAMTAGEKPTLVRAEA